MKKAISKLSILLLAVVMMFTSIVPVFAEEQPAEQVEEQVIDPQLETAKKLLQEGLTVEQIARCTDLPLEKVQELANITQN